jgi:hypothetical protein
MCARVNAAKLNRPDFVSSNGAGTNTTTIPSAVIVAFFAYLATRVVARYGFGRQREDG